MDSGSRASGPAITESMSAASRTVRVMGPLCDRAFQRSACGHMGTRPSEGLSPKIPHRADGMRIDPEPSEPWATGPSPAATAEPAPPDDAPDVRRRFHGLAQGGPSRLSHMSLYPKCEVLVFPSRIPPDARSLEAATPSSAGTLFSKNFEPMVVRMPA